MVSGHLPIKALTLEQIEELLDLFREKALTLEQIEELLDLFRVYKDVFNPTGYKWGECTAVYSVRKIFDTAK